MSNFNNELTFPKELLPCEIGKPVYTINRSKNYMTGEYIYGIDNDICSGFIIDVDERSNKNKIYPAYDTWDGWVKIIDDDNFGYFTSKNEARNKIKELKELDEIEWIEKI